MTKTERHAMMILAGCPTGATLDALKARGIAKETLTDMVARGLIWSQDHTMARPAGLVVRRYHLVVRDAAAAFKKLASE